MVVKAVIFDFIGTLVCVRGYSLEASKMKLYKCLCDAGFDLACDDFLVAYTQAHEKYRVVRYRRFVEVTNAVWIADALCRLGFSVDSEDERIKAAVNVFFEDYLRSLRVRRCARKILSRLSRSGYKLGLVSNFTYAPLIYAALRQLGLEGFFDVVLVSADVGWRKPHGNIFQEALKRLGVSASEAIYVGDSPDEDIRGAKKAGMLTIHVASQFFPQSALRKSRHRPDYAARSLCDAGRMLFRLLELSE
ncbi:HAD-IA family hydrolase [Candidatus Bathyarchaeota archaeon]|nr:HAD-IA family hydrolase [Candidatus Bathyarchaeota archaeon]